MQLQRARDELRVFADDSIQPTLRASLGDPKNTEKLTAAFLAVLPRVRVIVRAFHLSQRAAELAPDLLASITACTDVATQQAMAVQFLRLTSACLLFDIRKVWRRRALSAEFRARSPAPPAPPAGTAGRVHEQLCLLPQSIQEACCKTRDEVGAACVRTCVRAGSRTRARSCTRAHSRTRATH